MDTVTIRTPKTTLSQRLARVEAGEEIVLARGKTPIPRPAPCQARTATRRFGALRGVISVGAALYRMCGLPERLW